MKKLILLLSVFVCGQLCAEWVIDATHLKPGDNDKCPDGGTLVTFSDTDNSDYEASVYICDVENGEDGCKGVAVPMMNTPAAGCVTIKSGLSCDGDNSIDADQTVTETPVCGVKGTDGTITISVDGNGTDGADGADGKVPEIIITDEPAGKNCEVGGKKVETRSDSDGDGTFETVSVSYVCAGVTLNGKDGEPGKDGESKIVGQDGENGEKGERGEQGEAGDPGESGEPGAAGSDGRDMLMSVVDEAAGENCPNGGKKFMSGADADGNGVLDEAEISNSYYVCNGVDAVEASDSVKESGCTVTSVDTDAVLQLGSIISNIYKFVSDLF